MILNVPKVHDHSQHNSMCRLHNDTAACSGVSWINVRNVRHHCDHWNIIHGRCNSEEEEKVHNFVTSNEHKHFLIYFSKKTERKDHEKWSWTGFTHWQLTAVCTLERLESLTCKYCSRTVGVTSLCVIMCCE